MKCEDCKHCASIKGKHTYSMCKLKGFVIYDISKEIKCKLFLSKEANDK